MDSYQGQLLIASRDGRPVYVKDVATVVAGAAEPGHRSWMFTRTDAGTLQKSPMVTVAFAKRRDANAVVVADDLLQRLDAVRGRLVPEDIAVTVSRNYGETATEKADELLFHLALATVSIVLLITVAVGWREGLVVLVVMALTVHGGSALDGSTVTELALRHRLRRDPLDEVGSTTRIERALAEPLDA